MLAKEDVAQSPTEIDALKKEIETLTQKEQDLKGATADAQTTLDALNAQTSDIREQIEAVRAATEKLASANENQSGKIQNLIKQIEEAPPAKADDVIEDQRGGEENYLMGLKVDGRKIAILIDASASMTDEKLIDIIQRKSQSDQVKQQGPKWQRTKRVAKWLLSRLPKTAQVSVITFNDKVRFLGGAAWINARDSNNLNGLLGDLEQVVPTGPTNLQKALDFVQKERPSNIYLVTDGLPTEGRSSYKSLNPFAKCNSITGGGSTISGDCRVKLFRQSVKDSAPLKTPTNVVLLPLEGDPQAAPEFWLWSAQTGGLLISPAINWP
ncbi:vWA domain-containing protein [Aestuariispira insulae]|nr:vWA domain-containing protein [Aestuariispira insulae]